MIGTEQLTNQAMLGQLHWAVGRWGSSCSLWGAELGTLGMWQTGPASACSQGGWSKSSYKTKWWMVSKWYYTGKRRTIPSD